MSVTLGLEFNQSSFIAAFLNAYQNIDGFMPHTMLLKYLTRTPGKKSWQLHFIAVTDF